MEFNSTDKRAEGQPLVQAETQEPLGNPGNSTYVPYGGVVHNYLATTVQGPVMGQIMVQNPAYQAPPPVSQNPWDHDLSQDVGMPDESLASFLTGDLKENSKKKSGNKVATGIHGNAQWIPRVYNEATVVTPCWLCNQTDSPETLFDPCECVGLVHRHCFRKWRQGWINPKNYFNCPRCLHNYNIEQIKDSEVESEEKIRRNFKIKLLQMLLMVALCYGAMVGFWAGFTYLVDTGNKNIPIGCKYMLTSVVAGAPNQNTTQLWETNFKREDVHVWPYYTMFGVLLTSVVILLVFCMMGCSFKQEEYRKNRRCCDDCCGGTTSNAWCYMYQPWPSDCSCDCCSGGGGCSGGDCKCDGLGEGAIIIILVIIVAVIVSAVFVVIFYTLQKSALLYDRMSAMIMEQARELEGETIVLGKNETWRPLDAV